jgi:hypothetical protein
MNNAKLLKEIYKKFNEINYYEPLAKEVFNEMSKDVENFMTDTQVSWAIFRAFHLGHRITLLKDLYRF